MVGVNLYTGEVSIQEQQQSLKGIHLYYIVRLVTFFPFREQDRVAGGSFFMAGDCCQNDFHLLESHVGLYGNLLLVEMYILSL